MDIPEDLVAQRKAILAKYVGRVRYVPTRKIGAPSPKHPIEVEKEKAAAKKREVPKPTPAEEAAKQSLVDRGEPTPTPKPTPLTETPFEAIQREARYTPAPPTPVPEKRLLPEFKTERLKDEPVFVQKLGKYVVKPIYDPVRKAPVKTAAIFGASFLVPYLPIARVATRVPRVAKAVRYGIPTAYVGVKGIEVAAAPKGERLTVVREAAVTEVAPAFLGGRLGAAAKPYTVARYRSLRFAGKWRIPMEVSPEFKGFPFKAEGGFAVPVKAPTREAMILTPPKEFQIQLRPKPYEPLPPLRTVEKPTAAALLEGVKRPPAPYVIQREPVKILIRPADVPKPKLTQLELTRFKPAKPEFVFRQPQLEYRPVKPRLFVGKKAQVLEPTAVPERVYKRLITPITERVKPAPAIEGMPTIRKEVVSPVLVPITRERPKVTAVPKLKAVTKPKYKEIVTPAQIPKMAELVDVMPRQVSEQRQRQLARSMTKRMEKVFALTAMGKPLAPPSRLLMAFPKPPRRPVFEKLPTPTTPIPKLNFRFPVRKRVTKKKDKKLPLGAYKPSLFGIEIGKFIEKAPKFTTGIGVRLPVR